MRIIDLESKTLKQDLIDLAKTHNNQELVYRVNECTNIKDLKLLIYNVFKNLFIYEIDIYGEFSYTDKNGHGFSYKNNLLHSFDDKPSLVDKYTQEWHKEGVLHRDGDLPANIYIIEANGFNYNEISYKKYYKEGVLHRDGDLPAYIKFYFPRKNLYEYEEILYYKNGVLHRDNDEFGRSQPAIINKYGNGTYYKKGVLHRDNDENNLPQPAIYDEYGSKPRYYKDGVEFFPNRKQEIKKELLELTNKINLLSEEYDKL